MGRERLHEPPGRPQPISSPASARHSSVRARALARRRRNRLMEHAASARAVEQTTTLALEERAKLVKSLRRFDMVFFTVCAFVGLDTLGTLASNGAQGFTWQVVLAATFVVPYALLMAEV